MVRAIISDIHSNLDALEAVLDDIAQQGIESIYCLGDVIGYGPCPRECIDHAMRFEKCLLGNHDQAALFDPEGFSRGAEQAIFWTRSQLEWSSDNASGGSSVDTADQERRWNFLCGLPRVIREDPFLFVHGSARNPLSEYVFPDDAANSRKMERIFEFIPKYCLQGHTHVPGVFLQSGRFIAPEDTDYRFQLGADKVMINVGSVGQPRDGIPQSCYVVLDEDVVNFRRVEYPVGKAVERIHSIEGLDPFLGDRLLEGR